VAAVRRQRLYEYAAAVRDWRAHAGMAQRTPERHLIGSANGTAEILLECLDRAHSAESVTSGKDCLGDPPWFSPELNRMGAEYFRSQQIEVVYSAPAALPSSQHDQHRAALRVGARAGAGERRGPGAERRALVVPAEPPTRE
jgi:hypothetical protein